MSAGDLGSRLVAAVARRTGLPASEVEGRRQRLPLPVGDIEFQLEHLYQDLAEVGRLHGQMLARLEELRADGLDLEDPVVQEELNSLTSRITELRGRVSAFEASQTPFRRELENLARVEKRHLKLWHVERLEDGLFVLTYRQRDLDRPSGVKDTDALQIYLDTTPGQEGAEVFLLALT